MKKVLVIVGPTAIGKTEFGIRCAEAFHGEIISGDSIQIYRGLDIGSAKPTQEERMAQLAVIAEPFKEDSFWEKWLRLIRFLREKNPIRLR